MNPQEGDSGECFKHFSKDICYQLQYMDLKETKMHPQVRQRVLHWMMQQVAAHKLSRKIYGLACYYFDLYLQKIKEKGADPLQGIAIVCLILASKLDNRTFFRFVSPQLPLASIFELEQRVCLKLNFRLHPETYMQILDELMHEWDAFTLTHQPQFQATRFHSGGLQGVNRAIRMFQLMDCVNLGTFLNYFIINSLKYSYVQLCFNLFYLEIYRELYGVVEAQWEGKGGIEFGRKVYRDEKEYGEIFGRFMRREMVEEMMADLDVEVGIYLLPFLRMKSKLKRKEDQQQSVYLQSVNQSILEVSSMIIQRYL